jgi:hypothetical protein
MTIRYEGINTDPIKMAAWAKPEKDDPFVKFVVTNYMLSFPSKVVNWSAKIKVIFSNETKIKYLVSEILDLDDGKSLKVDL